MALDAVIVGNGVAGIEAARTLRALRPDARIRLVSEEREPFFSRTGLMYVLAGQLRAQDLEPYPRSLYAELGVELVRARAVSIASRRLELAGAAPLSFDVALLALGSRPRPPPWPGSELRGIGHFVSWQDLEWLSDELDGRPRAADPGDAGSPYRRRASVGGRALTPLVVGGGLIGIEVVEALLARGRRARFAIRERWFWPIALDARESAWVVDALRRHGTWVDLETELERFVDDGSGAVGAVILGGRELACDLVVTAIGVLPNVIAGPRLAGGGIEVDLGLRTSIEGVYAAGDCAALPVEGGGHRPEQLWYTARDQGRVAGRALAGREATYRRKIPYNSAKLMDIEYTTVGRVPPSDEGAAGLGELFLEERGPVRSMTRLVLDGERLVGFNALGRRYDHTVIARWIEEQRDVAYVRSRLGEAAFDTELVPKPRW